MIASRCSVFSRLPDSGDLRQLRPLQGRQTPVVQGVVRVNKRLTQKGVQLRLQECGLELCAANLNYISETLTRESVKLCVLPEK